MDNLIETFTPKEYVNRPGTTDSGRDYEFKMGALLFLRCIGEKDTDHAWFAMNVDHCGAFDDLVLYKQTNQEEIVYLIQLKHSEKSSDIRADEFKTKKNGPFYLKKYFDDMAETKRKKNNELSYLFNNEYNIVYVLFTNRGITGGCDFLKPVARKSYPDYKFNLYQAINTSLDKELTIFQFDYKKLNEDAEEENFFLFTKQLHVDSLDDVIRTAIKDLIRPIKLSQEILIDIVLKFVNFVMEWSKGLLGGHYPMNKTLVIRKLTELLLEPHKFDLRKSNWEINNKTLQWDKIVIDKDLIIINDIDDDIINFIENYIHEAIGVCRKDTSLKKAIRDDLNKNMLRVTANKDMNDEYYYEFCWKIKKIPLVLKVNKSQREQVQNILKLSKGLFKFIVLIQDNKTNLKIPWGFSKIVDLSEEEQKIIGQVPVKLQGKKSTLTLEKHLKKLSVKDAIKVISGKFNIGGGFEPLPSVFVEINLKRIWLENTVLASATNDEMFLIKCESEFSFTVFIRKYDLDVEYSLNTERNNCQIIIFDDEHVLGEALDRFPSCHLLTLHDIEGLEWITSKNTMERLMKYRIIRDERAASAMKATELIENIGKKCMVLISANPGMGKTTLLNYIALNAPSDIWVLRINLPEYKDYLKSYTADNFQPFLKNVNSLDRIFFEQHLKSKKVLFLLDAFDEVPVSSQNGAKIFLKFIHDSGFPLCITTRPSSKMDLEQLLKTTSLDLCLFTRLNQEYYLEQYFNKIAPTGSRKQTICFVKHLLDLSKENLDARDKDFTGIPLQTIMLAEVFEDDYLNYLKNSDFTPRKFDLLYLYQHFIEKKIRIAFSKIESTSEDMFEQYKICRTFYALQLIFSDEDLKTLQIKEKLKGAFVVLPNLEKIIQKDGIVVAEDEGNVTFVHRTFAEYLVSVWLSENIHNEKYQKIARVLIKKTFEPNFILVRKIFDRIVCENCPLHLAIMEQRVDAVKQMIDSGSADYSHTDKCERGFLHIIASWGLDHPAESYKDGWKPLVSRKMAMDNAMMEILDLIPDEQLTMATDDLLHYNAWDYAFLSRSLNIANVLCARIKNCTTNIVFGQSEISYCIRYAEMLCYLPLLWCVVSNFVNMHKSKKIEMKWGELVIDLDFLISPKMKTPSGKSNETALHLATIFCNLDAMKWLLAEGADVDSQDESGRTAIHWAVRYGLIDQMSLLLSNGANLDIKDSMENTVLHLAARYGLTDSVIWLLSKGIGLEKKNQNGMTALHWASACGHLDIVKLLASHGADLENKCNNGFTSLHYAANTEHVDVVDFLVSNGANLDARDGSDMAAIHLAAMGRVFKGISQFFVSDLDYKDDEKDVQACRTQDGYKAIINRLLQTGASVNAENKAKTTPLHVASENGQKDIVSFLLAKGANIEAEDLLNNNPLSIAAYAGFVDIVELFILKKANVNAALMCAVYKNNANAIKLLLCNKPNLEIVHRFKVTVLAMAAQKGHLDIVKLLLSAGANPNTRSGHNKTALHLAVEEGHLHVVETLVTHRADVEAMTESNKRPLLLAIQHGHVAIVNSLIKNGAKTKGLSGCCPLAWAINRGHQDTVDLLLARGETVDDIDKNNIDIMKWAAFNNMIPVMQILLSGDENVWSKNYRHFTDLERENKLTALHVATEKNHVQIVKMLLSNGANVNAKCGNETSLHYAAKMGHVNIAKLLLANGADLEVENDNKITPLLFSTLKNSIETVRLFLLKNANIEQKDNHGNTSLFWACFLGHAEIARLLLSHGADTEVKSLQDMRPIHAAALNNQIGIISLLSNKGVDINARTSFGATAIQLAISRNHRRAVELLFNAECA